jgi:tRNA uridine 5-carboxymethylaminomethyl modification enzyme
VRRFKNLDPIILKRDQAYIGVLIDDLVTKGTTEPYRMFTSRAEYRLLLRQDNADQRLSQIAYDIGLLKPRRYEQWRRKESAIEAEITRLEATRRGSDTLAQLLRRPEIRYTDLECDDVNISTVKYAGYIARQANEISKLRSLEDKQIPAGFDYAAVPSLRNEARQKLLKIQPATLGQASRISGVSPADVSILMVWLKRGAAASEAKA